MNDLASIKKVCYYTVDGKYILNHRENRGILTWLWDYTRDKFDPPVCQVLRCFHYILPINAYTLISLVILTFPVLVKLKRGKKILVPHYPGHSCIRPANNNGRLGRSPDSCFLNAPHHLKRRYYRLSCSQLRHSGCCGSTGSPSPSSASYVVLRKTFCFHIIFCV